MIGKTSCHVCFISELIVLLFVWLERSISGMRNRVISADHLFCCPHAALPPCPTVFGNHFLCLKYFSCSSQSVISLPVCSLGARANVLDFCCFLFLFHPCCPRSGWWRWRSVCHHAGQSCWLQGERVQVTLGSQENPQHHHPPYGLSLFPCSWAQSEWSWIHPSVLKGKFSPRVQRESVPTGAVSLEKDRLKL